MFYFTSFLRGIKPQISIITVEILWDYDAQQLSDSWLINVCLQGCLNKVFYKL